VQLLQTKGGIDERLMRERFCSVDFSLFFEKRRLAHATESQDINSANFQFINDRVFQRRHGHCGGRA
jgi:hypothetical protein